MPARIGGNLSGYDFWPLIADCFLALLAVFVFMVTAAKKPDDPRLVAFRGELDARCTEQVIKHVLSSYEIEDYQAKLVYSPSSIAFATADWDIPDSMQAHLREHLSWFRARQDFIRLIRIEGHSDSRPITGGRGVTPYQDNLQLSQNRARAVFNVLFGLGAKESEGLQSIIDGQIEGVPDSLRFLVNLYRAGKCQVAGFGATRPRVPEDPMNDANRRVEIIVEFEHVPAGKAGETGAALQDSVAWP